MRAARFQLRPILLPTPYSRPRNHQETLDLELAIAEEESGVYLALIMVENRLQQPYAKLFVAIRTSLPALCTLNTRPSTWGTGCDSSGQSLGAFTTSRGQPKSGNSTSIEKWPAERASRRTCGSLMAN